MNEAPSHRSWLLAVGNDERKPAVFAGQKIAKLIFIFGRTLIQNNYSVIVIKLAIQRSGKTLADLDQLVYGSS